MITGVGYSISALPHVQPHNPPANYHQYNRRRQMYPKPSALSFIYSHIFYTQRRTRLPVTRVGFLIET